MAIPDFTSLRPVQTKASTPDAPLTSHPRFLPAQPTVEDSPVVLAGYGYGLPISRLYARYFGGDLQIISMEGWVGFECPSHWLLGRGSTRAMYLPIRHMVSRRRAFVTQRGQNAVAVGQAWEQLGRALLRGGGRRRRRSTKAMQPHCCAPEVGGRL